MLGKDEVASSNLASSSNSLPLESMDLGGFLLFSKHFWNIRSRGQAISTPLKGGFANTGANSDAFQMQKLQ